VLYTLRSALPALRSPLCALRFLNLMLFDAHSDVVYDTSGVGLLRTCPLDRFNWRKA